MPQNITDVVTYTAPIVAPASGDPETAASVVTAVQGLANRTAALAAVLGATTGRIPGASVHNGIVSVTSLFDVALGNTNNPAALTLLSGLTITVPGALVGDLLLIAWNMQTQDIGAGAGSLFGNIEATQTGGAATYVPGSHSQAALPGSGTNYVQMGAVCVLPVTAAGSVVLQAYWGGSVANLTRTVNTNALVALLLRP